MRDVDQAAFERALAESRNIRQAVGQLAEKARAEKAAHDARWGAVKPALEAMRDSPSPETARAYVAAHDEASARLNEFFAARERRDGAIAKLNESNYEILKALGVVVDSRDREV